MQQHRPLGRQRLAAAGVGDERRTRTAQVCALTVYNGELIAGGWFTTAGGVTCNCIARWDGSAWQPLGSGMSGHHAARRA